MSIIPSNSVIMRAMQGINSANNSLADISTKFATGKNFARSSDDLFASIEAASNSTKIKYENSALANLTRARSYFINKDWSLGEYAKGRARTCRYCPYVYRLPENVRAQNVNIFDHIKKRVEEIPKTAQFGRIKLLDDSLNCSQQSYNEINLSTKTRKVKVNFQGVENPEDMNVISSQIAELGQAFNANIAGSTELEYVGPGQFGPHNGGGWWYAQVWDVYYRAATGVRSGDAGEIFNGFIVTDNRHFFARFKLEINGEEYNAYHNTRWGIQNQYLMIIKASVDEQYKLSISDSEIRDQFADDYAGYAFLIKLKKTTKYSANSNTDERYPELSDLSLIDGGDDATINKFVEDFNEDMKNIVFKQENEIDITEVKSKLLLNNNISGILENGSISIESDKYLDKIRIKDVKVDDKDGITIKIADSKGENEADFKSGVYTKFYAGTTILLTNNETGDIFRLTINPDKDLELDTEEKRKKAEEAFVNEFGLLKQQKAMIIVGTDIHQNMELDFKDMRWSKLTDNEEISINSQDKAMKATRKLKEIEKEIAREIANNSAMEKKISSLVMQRETTTQNLSAVVDKLQSLDIANSREELDNSLLNYNASINAIMTNNRAKRILQSLLDI